MFHLETRTCTLIGVQTKKHNVVVLKFQVYLNKDDEAALGIDPAAIGEFASRAVGAIGLGEHHVTVTTEGSGAAWMAQQKRACLDKPVVAPKSVTVTRDATEAEQAERSQAQGVLPGMEDADAKVVEIEWCSLLTFEAAFRGGPEFPYAELHVRWDNPVDVHFECIRNYEQRIKHLIKLHEVDVLMLEIDGQNGIEDRIRHMIDAIVDGMEDGETVDQAFYRRLRFVERMAGRPETPTPGPTPQELVHQAAVESALADLALGEAVAAGERADADAVLDAVDRHTAHRSRALDALARGLDPARVDAWHTDESGDGASDEDGVWAEA